MEYSFLTWLGHASFLIKTKGLNIYIDPYKISKESEKADLIFITHPHRDHFSQGDIAEISNSKTRFVAPKGTSINSENVAVVKPGDSGSELGISFEVIAAYNVDPLRANFHNKSNGWVGYVIEIEGKKIYHPGDTDLIEEMKGINVDLALIPCGGKYAMDIDEAIEATKIIRAKNFAPIHYKALVGKEGSDKLEKKFVENVKNAIILEEKDPTYSF